MTGDRRAYGPMLGLVFTLLGVGAGVWHVQTRLARGAGYWHVLAPYPLDAERFGVGGSAALIDAAQWAALGAAWYIPWGATLDPPHPNGVAVLQTIRIQGDTPLLDQQTLAELIRANPAGVWRIGNEPDSPWQDNATPEQYARVYHRLYRFIKAHDPTALVAFGGLVQATPLRLLYLDQVWQAYAYLYREQMPVDVWTLHSFILPETLDGWGAGIPPGMQAYANRGIQYQIRDHDDMDVFSRRFRDFRRWMADHGQRDKPLIVPEYGCLMWPIIKDEDGRDFGDDRVIAFMVATFDFFLTATDPATGYPADDDRLVQAWAWYGIDDDVYYDGQKIGEGYGGDLFTGPYTKTMTPLGQAYAAYVADLDGADYTDLWPLQPQADLSAAVWGQASVLTLTVDVANHGRQPASAVPVQFSDGDPLAGGLPIGPPQTVPHVPGRYAGTATARVAWTTLVSGTRPVWVTVDPGDAVPESDETNNRALVALDMTVDLVPTSLRFDPPAPLWDGAPVTVTATAALTHAGFVGVPEGVAAGFWVGDPGGEEPAARRTFGPLAAGAGAELTATLTLTAPGRHTVLVALDPDGAIVETDESNNRLTATVLVATQRLFLPLVTMDLYVGSEHRELRR